MLRSLLFCLLTVVALCCPFHANAETDSVNSDRYALYYYHDRIDLQEDYLDNAMQMARIKDMLLHSPHIDSIAIYAYSSPEGSPKWNNWLAVKRAEAAKAFILSNLSNDSILQPENIILHPMGENWEGLYEELYANYHLLNRDAVLRIMRAKVGTETKKWRLQNLDGGYTYTWIIRNHMPRLRVATWICVYVQKPDFVAPVIQDYKPDLGTIRIDTLPLPELLPMPVAEKRKSTMFALKTNLLYDAALVPNLGVEFYLGKQWSIAANWQYAWWNNKTWFWRTYGGELGVRKWLGKQAKAKPLSGHHVGLYGQILTYDFMLGSSGYMSGNPRERLFDRPSYSVGLEYGYSLPIAKRLNLDFVIGLGYLRGIHNEYRLIDDCYVWQAQKKVNYFGPTKAEITLVWLLGSDNINKRKGGKK